MTQHSTVHRFLSFKRGETKGQEYYFLLFWPQIRSYAASIVKDFDVAADVANDCFAKAWLSRQRFKDEEHLRRFLFFMTRVCAMAYLRRDRLRQAAENTWVESHADDPEAFPLREDQKEEMLDIIYQLPFKRGLSLWYRYYKKWPVKSIAVFLGVAEQTVRNNINQGKEQARKRWKGKNNNDRPAA